MDKKELLYFWDAVNSITENLKAPEKNKWAIEHANSFKPVKIGCDEVCVFYMDDITIVGINGSDGDKKEWRGNFDAYPIVDGCHHGFRKDGLHILHTVAGMITIDKPVVVVGHSRGGALAQIFAHYANELYGHSVECITYGSPRPFTLWKKPKFSHTRVLSQHDPVGHIPPVFFPPFWKSYQTTKVTLKNKLKQLFTKEQRRAIRKDRKRTVAGEALMLRHGDYGYMIEHFM